MTIEQAIEMLEHNWTKIDNPDYTEEELNKVLEMTIDILERIEKNDGKSATRCHETISLIKEKYNE